MYTCACAWVEGWVGGLVSIYTYRQPSIDPYICLHITVHTRAFVHPSHHPPIDTNFVHSSLTSECHG